MVRLFKLLPLEMAMCRLLPQAPSLLANELDSFVKPLAPELQAAAWLYLDDLDRSHAISQSIDGPVGAYWHGIMHRREGDFWNSKYWLRQARGVDLDIPDYEPSKFVDQVEAAGGSNPAELVDMQRREWMALFTYCAERTGVQV